jgi:hypothetical protein
MDSPACAVPQSEGGPVQNPIAAVPRELRAEADKSMTPFIIILAAQV